MTSTWTMADELRSAASARRAAGRDLRGTVARAVRAGLSQRQIASHLGVSQPEVNRLLHSSAAKDAAGRSRTWMTARDAARAATKELAHGDELMAFKVIIQARDHLLTLRDPDDVREWLVEPAPIADRRFDALLRVLTRRTVEAEGGEAPSWATPVPLSAPWTLHPLPSGKARAMREAPADLAALGIFITEDDLATA
jgi:predicted XRE-type DNA-binding protein